MTLSVLVAAVSSSLLLHVTRRRIARSGEQITHNDVAGPILTTIGTVLAVMLSFMVAGVWQEYDQAAQTAQNEASAISDLYHLSNDFPGGLRTTLQNELQRYAALVVGEEWPLMRRGAQSIPAHDAAYRIQAIVGRYAPASAQQQTLQQKALDMTTNLLDARRQRILDNREGIPIILWCTMLFLGATTVGFSCYFRVDRPLAQYVMVVALSTVIAITFSLIAQLDYPFRGDVAVDSSAFTEVQRIIQLDSPAH
jgi:hypothetical protein